MLLTARRPANTNACPIEVVSYVGWPMWAIALDIELQQIAAQRPKASA